MAGKRADPVIATISTDALEALLVRSAERLAPEDHALLAGLVTAFLLLSRLVREGRATLHRLRRLFGLRKSEKKSRVFPPEPEGDNAGSGSTDPASPTPKTPGSSDSSADESKKPDDATPPDARAKNPRKGHGRLGAGAYNVTPTAVGHQDLKPGDLCPGDDCGGRLYDLNRPELILRIFGQAPLFAKSWACERLRCSRCQAVYTAKHPPEACGPRFAESAVAVIAALRFWFGTPHYRLERVQEALGTPVPDATQWEVLHARAVEIHPAYQHLLHLGAQAPLLHGDDTHMPVLQYMGKRREKLVEQDKLPRTDRTGLFTTGIVAIVPEGPLALFVTGRRHMGENVAALLERRAKELPPPLLMSDGLNHNAPKGHPVVECGCVVHGRRGIIDQAENLPAECQYVLGQIGEVYAVEDVCREENLSPQERLWMHQLVSAPVMMRLRAWMTQKLEEKRIEPNSGMGQALNYMLERWDKMTVFLRIAGAPIDNNICERILKLAIVYRKNSLFFRNERGAVVGDIYQTLIHTAVLHDENPFDYLIALMANYQSVAAAPADWMPWNYRQTLAKAAAPLTDAPCQAQVTPAVVATPAAPAPSAATPPATGPDATTSTAVTAPPSAAASAPTEIEPAGAPSAPPSPSTTPPSPQAQGKRSPPSTGRAKPAQIPPPAFVLFTLLCLTVSLVGGLYPFAAPVTPSQTIPQSPACSTSAEELTSSDAARASSAVGIAYLVAAAQQPLATTTPEAGRSGRVPSRSPL
jgi:transposase